MTPEEFCKAMKEIRDNPDGDTESDHSAADELMCQVLKGLGYGAGVNVYKRMEKWYS